VSQGTGPAVVQHLRILQVIKCMGYGGAEKLLVDMVANGDKQSFEYEVAYVLSAEDALVPAIRDGGTPVHPLRARGNADLTWMGRLRTLILDGKFDVVHFHLPYTASLGRLVVATIPRARRPAVVYTEHSLWNKHAVLVKGLNRATIGLDQSLIAVSPAAHEALPRMLKGRARVIIHGVDVSRSDALISRLDDVRKDVRSELGISVDQLLVMAVSNLRPEKGYDVLLDAARVTADHNSTLRFAAVGRGPLAAELDERRRALGLDERFQFLGEREDVLRLLVGSDIFVLPSHHEGLPVALMEATSAGLPIVATNVGGIPQVITDGADGLLVPPGSAVEMAAALERLTDTTLRLNLGRGAKEKSAMFDVTSASRQVEAIYRLVATAGQ
jgi:glycosyltransferase involved in cell wall biosynthesis